MNVSILIGTPLHDSMLFVCSTSGDEDCKTFTADEEIEFDSSNPAIIMLNTNKMAQHTFTSVEADKAACKVTSITAGFVSLISLARRHLTIAKSIDETRLCSSC